MVDLIAGLSAQVLELLEAATVVLKFLSALLGLLFGAVVAVRRIHGWLRRRRSTRTVRAAVDPVAGSSDTSS